MWIYLCWSNKSILDIILIKINGTEQRLSCEFVESPRSFDEKDLFFF